MCSVGACPRRSAKKMNEKLHRGVSIAILGALALSLFLPLSARSQGDFVEGLMERMSVEEKVGQLFLVTFMGSEVGPDSDIAQLVAEYKVGGVVLLASNGNFTNDEDTPQQVLRLANGLQELASSSAGENYIPLFIAVEHEGDGYPYTPLRGGMTALPNRMALGATWSGENAETVGEIAGRELAALGVNMLFGPSLDVLNNPRPTLQGELGTRTFGGDPYWVGKLGQAYIRGVHRGSEGKVATVAKHFPGYGDSDRSPDEEVATINKSLQELRRIELPPFFAVTKAGEDPLGVTDALMTSHIRYRGFQGNIRQLTRPISFDAQGLGALMALPEFESWRGEGGLIVSGALGVPAVRRYYDPQLQSFPCKRIAQEALLAGNDLLVLSHFALTDDWSEQFGNIKATIEFFREKYEGDPNFQARVDEALRRILTLKHRLYPRFDLGAVQVEASKLAEVGQGSEEVFKIAREAITLIYPGPEELADRLPSPPLADEDVLIFTDAREGRDRSDRPSFPLIEPDALEKTIVQLYRPEATGQVDPSRIHSLTFGQLKSFLASEGEGEIEGLIEEADWIIFAMLNVDPQAHPQSDAVKAFLRERADALRGKKVMVLVYGAPYYLDTTEVSKLTAYFGVYSKVHPFSEASVRVLFQEFTPAGAPPVSVEGINYDLITRMEPDPEQIVQVMLAGIPPEGEGTPTPVDVNVGDTLRLKTGVIVDRNGHPVPDGTPVTFRFFYPAESLALPRQEVTTVDGMAGASIVLEREGQLEITAASSSARKSTTLVVTIKGGEPVTFATVVPTPTFTPTPTVIPTSTPTSTPLPPTLTPTLTPTPVAVLPEKGVERRLGGGDLLLSLLSISLVGGAGYVVQRKQCPSTRLRTSLMSLVWGLVGYNLYGLGLPRVELFQRLPKRWGAPLICLAFATGYTLTEVIRERRKVKRSLG